MVAGAIGRKFMSNDETFYNMLAGSIRRSRDGGIEGYGEIKVPHQGWF